MLEKNMCSFVRWSKIGGLLLFVGLLFLFSTVVLGARAQYSRDLRKIAASYGFAPPSADSHIVALNSSFTKMVFEEEGRRMHFNGVLIWLNGVVAKAGNSWLLMDQDLRNIVHPLLRPDSAVADQGSRIVVLDAGHGGKDQGTRGCRGTLEKKVTMDIVKRVARKLQDSQVAVQMTRADDTYVSLNERCQKARKYGADVFVSIHANSTADATVCGIESFVMTSPGCVGTISGRPDPRSYAGNGSEPANMLLGYYVQKGVLSCTGGSDRGVKRARFEVLRNINCASVLVECGFLSNNREESMLNDPRYREAVANGVARGILTYLSRARSVQADLDRTGRKARVNARGQI